MVDVEFLTSVPIFASLNREQLQSLPGKLQPRRYQRGEVIFHEDDPADRMHIIVEGRVKISIASEDGRERDIALFQSGDCFGEMALLDGSNRSATATAVDATETMVLFRQDFLDFLGENPELAAEWNRMQSGELPSDLREKLPVFESSEGSIATRAASGKVINAIAEALPELIGGSADLAPSNNTMVKEQDSIESARMDGRNMHFGIREHAMGAMMNGMALHGGIRPYGGTFLVFSDYMRPSVRLAALMRQPVIYIWTHDSIFLGEDGPTHQPVVHLAALRAIPNLRVFRPADANETVMAWILSLEHGTGPSAILLSRQGLPIYDDTRIGQGSERGAYVLDREEGDNGPDIILLASGSEVATTREAAGLLREQGIQARVVSMPCWEVFETQADDYRESVLPRAVTARVAVEAGSPFGWERYVGTDGVVVGMDRFGASAPIKDLAENFGFTAGNVATQARTLLGS